GGKERAEVDVEQLVLARRAHGEPGAKGEARERVVAARERDRKPRAARGAREHGSQLARADEARGTHLAVAEPQPLHRDRSGRGRRERRRDRVEPPPPLPPAPPPPGAGAGP